MSLECGNDYEMKVVPHDLNVWLSRMYLGDADGFLLCITPMWTVLSIGQMKQHTPMACQGLQYGVLVRKI